MKSLSKSQLDHFHKKGYIKVPNLLKREIVLKMENEIWTELNEDFNIQKEDKSTWKQPLHSPRKAKYSITNEELINNEFRTVIDLLIGKSTWEEPKSWGGFLVNFPDHSDEVWSLDNKLWHWDYELFRKPELGGLVIFSFFSDVKGKGGGTLVVSGSHLALRKYDLELSLEQRDMKHGYHRKHFMKTHPYFKELTDPKLKFKDHIDWFMNEEQSVGGVALKVEELTGLPGDVVFCHPRLIHAPAGINLGDYPRIMRTKFLW